MLTFFNVHQCFALISLGYRRECRAYPALIVRTALDETECRVASSFVKPYAREKAGASPSAHSQKSHAHVLGRSEDSLFSFVQR